MLVEELIMASQFPSEPLLLNQKKVGWPGLHLAWHCSLSSPPSIRDRVWGCWVISGIAGKGERERERERERETLQKDGDPFAYKVYIAAKYNTFL